MLRGWGNIISVCAQLMHKAALSFPVVNVKDIMSHAWSNRVVNNLDCA